MPREEPERSLWVANHTQKQQDAKNSSLSDEKLRQEIAVLRIKKRRQRLSLDYERKKLVDRTAVTRELELFINDARVQLEAIPAKVAAYVEESERPVVMEEVRKDIERIMRGLASAKGGNE